MIPGTRGCLAALLCCACVSPLALAAGNEVQTAEFQVIGSLHESACYLDTSSGHQTLDLGQSTTANLAQIGDQGRPVTLQLKLQDCVRSEGGRRDERLGTLLWSASEPVATLTFSAVSDPDTPELIKVAGASGFGLRVQDVRGNNLHLGQAAPVWFVSPGDNQLTYYIRPERTAAALRPGAFRASLNVNLTYD
ncbi:type 1 fimbrial protein [Pseudomonas sp. TH05]|uniref:fimbrial protein n=1 Tax=unclassified Pseudomonas TaxID=196821 RepID=UPI001913D602|nr:MULTISPECIES: fimbrial protein [unclassified Pseudomonas]MBK5542519.1 type 1 fimbrial protein [Pseudomonas sp. TH07]MBK5554441.1 type 1 fimbrial protein [Pseudomonas sp. TH05]